jgi:DNA mismatch repair protein PMS2
VSENVGSELGQQRLQLVAQPVSKSTNFDMKGDIALGLHDSPLDKLTCLADLEELLHLMQDRPTGQMVWCSKARAMFAMRACRKSVMVGMPLTKNQMTSVHHAILFYIWLEDF